MREHSGGVSPRFELVLGEEITRENLEQRLLVQGDELLSAVVTEPVDVARVRPERIVHGDERDAMASALQRGHHHVRRVERVNVVRRKGVLLLDVVRPGEAAVAVVDVLASLSRAHLAVVRLNDGEIQWRVPFHCRTAYAGYLGSAVRKPILDEEPGQSSLLWEWGGLT